jgi:choline dehydrogenase-like flavoprotein
MCRASQTAIFGYVTECYDLYVVDTSFFPSIGAMNPALTAMANAIRVGDHLLSRMA